MKVVRYNSIVAAESAFRILEEGDWHSFQSYEVHRGIDVGLNKITRIIRRNGPIRVYAVFKDKKPILLAPLRRKWSGVWVVAGTTEGYDYVDFSYGGGATESDYSQAFDELMVYLRDKEKIRTIQWHYLDSRSRSSKYVLRHGMTMEQAVNNVEINIDYATHADYFATMSKSVRQNIRTAYNRLNRDGHTYSFKMYSACGIGEQFGSAESLTDLNACMDVYLKRQKEEYRKLSWGMEKYVRLCHYMSTSVNSPEHYFCILFIDDKVGAYMQGYINPRRNALEVPRLAIDSQFGWYSPGMLLLNESAKFLIDDRRVKMMDLCRGCEKYKFNMGGVGYETLNFNIAL